MDQVGLWDMATTLFVVKLIRSQLFFFWKSTWCMIDLYLAVFVNVVQMYSLYTQYSFILALTDGTLDCGAMWCLYDCIDF